MSKRGGFAQHIFDYDTWLRERNYSPRTIEVRVLYLRVFARWCEERSLERPEEITRPIMERFQHHLYLRRKKNGQPLTFSSQSVHLHAVQQFFRWLVREGRVTANPASDLELPRIEHRLPKDVLTAEEVELVLAQPNLVDPLGLRDRAIMELFYGTGIRRAELAKLSLWDVNVSRQTVFIDQGKGKKDRYVPIGERTLHWVERYRHEVRPLLCFDLREQHLFLSIHGGPMEPDNLSNLVVDYIEHSGLGKRGGCHLFRHTCGTLMLEGGADIRYVQEMLGHVSIETTQIYTRVSVARLRKVFEATHPGAMFSPPPLPPSPTEDDDENEGGEPPAVVA